MAGELVDIQFNGSFVQLGNLMSEWAIARVFLRDSTA